MELQSALDMAQDIPQVLTINLSPLISWTVMNAVHDLLPVGIDLTFAVQTLVQVPDLLQLQNLVDRLKQVGDLLTVSISQYGDLHLQVSTSLITVGSDFRKLRVLGVQGDFFPFLRNYSDDSINKRIM